MLPKIFVLGGGGMI
uniref:Uncharacterized protein n=1 Tax=Arundo donax TaxID=35708 RepID=A0A0A9BDP2_ARUDO